MIPIRVNSEKMKCGITVRPQSCVRMYYKNAPCNACVELCPENAVKVGLPGTKVLIDTSLCSSCEICVGACPYGVFTLSGINDYDRCMYLLDKEDRGEVSISCNRDKKDNSANIECLGALNAVLILFLFTSGVKRIKLNLMPCAECSYSEAMRQVQNRELGVTKRMLEHISAGYTESAIGDELFLEVKANVFAKSKVSSPVLSRRGFFKHLKTSMIRNLAAITEIVESEPVKRVEIGSKRSINNRKHLANNVYDTMLTRSEGSINASGFPVGKISVNIKECTFCRLCEKLCPTGAIAIDEQNNFEHNVYQCVGCGICIKACDRNCIYAEE
ncbi:MAG: 4Fe-4S dicluster domain-containing protein [Flexistipes sinusarabici]|uniref:4Fe-4S dicluster domain-containing protein n=1 Tax=Flexistipes sinusarabici TaxID=2352 RepID=A0A5D0MWX2_FLESI|nr:4Fe-4S binding protein [Flexistipes sinusarabici]TYB36670.1 MAG: 4Fe-4S dicluster domain-containing protein [Flexistipes sinusarabici]